LTRIPLQIPSNAGKQELFEMYNVVSMHQFAPRLTHRVIAGRISERSPLSNPKKTLDDKLEIKRLRVNISELVGAVYMRSPFCVVFPAVVHESPLKT